MADIANSRVRFVNGPLDGETCAYWQAPPFLHVVDRFDGCYELVAVIGCIEEIELRSEYRWVETKYNGDA